MIRRRSLALFVFALVPLAAQTAVDERIRRVTGNLAERMAALHVPGVSIAVIHDGRIEWARGFGVTRIDGPAVTPETLFQAASISKPVAALAVLRLVQAGKLDLDADVNRYLKSWRVAENSYTSETKVTLRGLLSHTAGMTVHGFPGYASDERLPSTLEILDGKSPANTARIHVDTKPGTIWRYSGGGYVVAQLLLEEVTGQPFAKLMQDTVLGPIGMTRSTYEQPLPKARLAEVAMPYRRNGQPVPGGPHVYPEMAPAGLWTTPSDLARYAIEVQQALAGKSSRVVDAATARRMVTRVMGDQGIGPGVGGSAKRPFFSHGGANEGYRCNLVAYNEGDGLVVMTNSDSGDRLASELLVAVAREYGWPDFVPVERTVVKVDPKVFDAYLGSYRLTAGPTLTVTREGVVDAQLDFEVDGAGKAAAVTIHQNGRDQRATRVAP